jgi:hypothetical protein
MRPPTSAHSDTPASTIEEDLDMHQLKLRCKVLEIERASAVWRCEEYKSLLEPVSGGHGASPAREGGEGIVISSRPDDQDQRRRQQ